MRFIEDCVVEFVRFVLVRSMIVDMCYGLFMKLRKVKSVRSCDDYYRFERIDEISFLINFGCNYKMI